VSPAADTTDFTAIHTCLRRGGRAIAAAMTTLDPADRRRVDAVRRYWEGYAGEVLAHHTVEDTIFYPALVERVPEAAEHLGRIDGDHHLLDELMDEGRAAIADVVAGGSAERAARVLGHLDVVMHEHLDYEDAELVPLFARHFDQDEYEALGKAAVKSLGLGKQALFTVPFVGSWLDADLRAHLLGTAPLPFRLMYRLTRRSHERLATAALGVTPGPTGTAILTTTAADRKV
jgi:hemerythrin-like domain-containing protein